MQKRLLGYVLLVLGFSGMALSAYLFVVGSGARMHLLEVTAFMIVGAASFFWGINFIYESANNFSMDHVKSNPELEEISPIQQQWRTINVAKQPAVAPLREQVSAEVI